MLGRVLLVTIACMLPIGLLARADIARASCVGGIIQSASPEDGASDVPVEVAPFIKGFIDPGSVELRTEAGALVPIQVRSGRSSNECAGLTVEILPDTLLQPDTSYVISATRDTEIVGERGPEFTRFTTGKGSVGQVELLPPTLRASVTVGNPYIIGNWSDVSACVYIGEAEQAELIARGKDGEELVRTFETGEVWLIWLSEVPECIEARARDAAGNLSEPARICGEQLSVRDASLSDYDTDNEAGEPNWLCENGLIGTGKSNGVDAGEAEAGGADAGEAEAGGYHSTDSGCSVGAHPGGSPPAGVWLLVWLVLGLCLPKSYKRQRLGQKYQD
jgi:hypothetical protein